MAVDKKPPGRKRRLPNPGGPNKTPRPRPAYRNPALGTNLRSVFMEMGENPGGVVYLGGPTIIKIVEPKGVTRVSQPTMKASIVTAHPLRIRATASNRSAVNA